MTANIRPISIRQPYAWAVVKKGERTENLAWSTKSGGHLFVHTEVEYGEEQWLQEEFGLCVPRGPRRGAFVAMYKLVDVLTESDDRWFEGE